MLKRSAVGEKTGVLSPFMNSFNAICYPFILGTYATFVQSNTPFLVFFSAPSVDERAVWFGI
jgi:hypothetical protein